jgi:hypothetical protein
MSATRTLRSRLRLWASSETTLARSPSEASSLVRVAFRSSSAGTELQDICPRIQCWTNLMFSSSRRVATAIYVASVPNLDKLWIPAREDLTEERKKIYLIAVANAVFKDASKRSAAPESVDLVEYGPLQALLIKSRHFGSPSSVDTQNRPVVDGSKPASGVSAPSTRVLPHRGPGAQGRRGQRR